MSKILVAEDNIAFLRVEEFNLRRAGHEVTTVGEGELALLHAHSDQFDLVVTDEQMPRMCGTDFLRRLRSLPDYASTPLILLTAKAFEIDVDRIEVELLPIRVMRKPASMVVLLDAIDELLQQNV